MEVRLATNRAWTDKSGKRQEQAEFHSIIIWGRQAEIVKQFSTKGSSILPNFNKILLALSDGIIQPKLYA